MSGTYHIRLFRPSDLDALIAITLATFEPVSIDRNIERLLGTFGNGDWKSRKAAAIREDCRSQPDGVFVAEDASGQVVGYVSTRLLRASGIGWIPNLAVAPEHQNLGLGRRLLEHALAWLRSSGMSVAKIETLEQNPIGLRLYPSLGFVEVARQVHYAMRLDWEEGLAGDE